MITSSRLTVVVVVAALVAALGSLGCESEPAQRQARERTPQPEPVKKAPPKKKVDDTPKNIVDTPPYDETTTQTDPVKAPPVEVVKKDPPKDPPPFAGWKRTKFGDGVWLETQGEKGEKRRVLVSAKVCLREGNYGLECLLCRRGTKEHESILVTSADARIIHAVLEAAGAKAGSPVQYEPKFQAPRGQPIKITIAYEQKGQVVSVPAQKWIRNKKTEKDLDLEWVFAGSKLYQNIDDVNKPPHYGANVDGGYICISNLMSAMFDLPINSPKPIDDRVFVFNTPSIPAVDTSVVLILEPIPVKK